tara:strand:+ start:5757 stop:7649 length:1893 start_codon:yes stop_codon:yes gene_type:complete
MAREYVDPLNIRGDVMIRNATKTTRLGVGTSGQVLTSDGTDVAWANSSSGFADPMSTRGDVIIRDATNTTARLGIGTNGQVLQSDGTDISWGTAGAGDMVLADVQTVTGAKTFDSGKLIYAGATSGTTTVNATAVAGTTTLTLPAATDTLMGKATTDTLTNKSFDVDGTGNNLTNIANANIKAGAAISMSKTAFVDGTGLTLSTDTLAVDASQTQITAIGTIATGTWEATDVAVAHGGTGASDAATALSNLGGVGLGDTNVWTASNTFNLDILLVAGKKLLNSSDADHYLLFDGSSNTQLRSPGSIVVDVDSDSDGSGSGESFFITKDGTATVLFQLREDGFCSVPETIIWNVGANVQAGSPGIELGNSGMPAVSTPLLDFHYSDGVGGQTGDDMNVRILNYQDLGMKLTSLSVPGSVLDITFETLSYSSLVSQTYTGTTTRAHTITANSLTTVGAFLIQSSSTDTSSRSLFFCSNASSSATGARTFHVAQASTADGIFVDHNADGKSLFIDAENTTADTVDVDCNALTTGSIARLYSNSSSTGTRNLVEITNDHASAVNVTPLKIQQDGVTSTNFKKHIALDGLTIWISDGTTAEGNLTGVEGDICLNGGTGAGQTAFCDSAGTNWTDM